MGHVACIDCIEALFELDATMWEEQLDGTLRGRTRPKIKLNIQAVESASGEKSMCCYNRMIVHALRVHTSRCCMA